MRWQKMDCGLQIVLKEGRIYLPRSESDLNGVGRRLKRLMIGVRGNRGNCKTQKGSPRDRYGWRGVLSLHVAFFLQLPQ